MPEVTLGSLALPGFWRVSWFGKLDRIPSPHSSPRIKAYLRPLPQWPKVNASSGVEARTTRNIHVGEMALLHLNAVLDHGKILPLKISPWVKRVQLSLDMTRVNQRIFRRFDHDHRGDPIIPVRNPYLRNDPDANTLFVGIGDGDDPFAYVVPCVENFRFFYSTSSTLTKAMFSGDFLDPNHHLWDAAESWINRHQRTAFMQLRKRMLDADARFLARFAFDPYALMQAREVFLYAAGQTAEIGERTIRALPPFEGKTDFVANVVEFESAGRRRTLITQFISCDWRPPFDHVEFLRDNDGRFDPFDRDQREKSSWEQRVILEPKDPPENMHLGEGPANAEIAPWRLPSTQIEERFPVLSTVPAIKRERKDATTVGGKPLIVDVPGPTVDGTVGDVRTSADEVAGVLISGLGLVMPYKEEIAADADINAGDTAYQITLNLLLMMQSEHMAHVEFIRTTDQVAYLGDVVLNVFPDDLAAEKRAWLYVDPARTYRRVALIASVERDGRTRYLIDIQHKRPKECSMLVVWDDAESDLQPGFLGHALLVCQKAEGASLKDLDHIAINWARLHHSAKQAGVAEAESLLRRTFSVGPVSGRVSNSDRQDAPEK